MPGTAESEIAAPAADSGEQPCAAAAGAALSQAQADRLAAGLKAVADPARIRILSLLRAQQDGEACVCHLTGPLGLKQPTVSHHLRVLLDAGLVRREQRGTWAHYRIDESALAALASALT